MSADFILKDIIFKKLFVERPSHVPDDLKINVSIAGQIIENAANENYLEIHLGVISEEESLIKIEIQAVSLFDGLVEGMPPQTLREFVEHQGLPVMFAMIRQQVLVLTSQMGMRSIKLNDPQRYNLQEASSVH